MTEASTVEPRSDGLLRWCLIGFGAALALEHAARAAARLWVGVGVAHNLSDCVFQGVLVAAIVYRGERRSIRPAILVGLIVATLNFPLNLLVDRFWP